MPAPRRAPPRRWTRPPPVSRPWPARRAERGRACILRPAAGGGLLTSDVLAAVEAAAALHQAGRLEAALQAYEAALARPDAPRSTLLQLLALLHTQAGRPGAALQAYDALAAEGGAGPALDPPRAAALNDRGLEHAQAGRHEAALADYDAALALAPGLAVAWSNRSAALRRLNRCEAARESAGRALALEPGYPEAYNALGLALFALNRLEEAQAAYRAALRLRADYAEAFNNLGIVLAAVGRLDKAEAAHAQAAALDPGAGAYPYNLALLALRRGDFAAGWRGYEHRWRRDGHPGPTYPDRRLWLGGEAIAGRTLLLHAEQGLGDTLQFCRFAPLAAAAGARVVLEVQPPLTRLMHSLTGVDAVVPIGGPPPPFDRQTPLMSLPLAFAAAPDDRRVAPPYLRAEAGAVASWRARLEDGAGPRIGLVWAGNAAHENDHNRSLPLQTLGPLVDAMKRVGARVFSLQTPLDPEARRRLEELGVIELGGGLGDFADTAALLEAIDLLVTVDTSIVHLAGALGRPAWLLLPAYGDWRWMDARADSPWYPSLRLFRQRSLGDWTPVLAEVSAALAGWVEG